MGDNVGTRLTQGRVISHCRQCSEEYLQFKCRVKRDKFCSSECGKLHRKLAMEVRKTECSYCHKEFIPRTAQLEGGRKPYCSISCSSTVNGWNDEIRANALEKRRAEGNFPSGSEKSNWKGGRIINRDGYVFIWIATKTYVLEHRYVMEQSIGRKLREGEIVHHINEDKLDNRIENLQIMTRAEHINHHRDALVIK